MDSKVLACFVLLAVCASVPEVLSQRARPQVAPDSDAVAATATDSTSNDAVNREKKEAVLPVTAYSGAYPYYSGYSYPYAYSYSAFDDGKYYPGKYERSYLYRSYPAAGGYYNYPGYYYY